MGFRKIYASTSIDNWCSVGGFQWHQKETYLEHLMCLEDLIAICMLMGQDSPRYYPFMDQDCLQEAESIVLAYIYHI